MSRSENKSRRQVRIESESEAYDSPAIEYRPPPRSAAEALGLDKDPADFDGEPQTADGEPLGVYPPDRIQAFLSGQITLGDLEGVTKEEQYQIAQLGFRCLESGKLDEADRIFSGLLALDPFDAYFNLALASVAHQRSDFETAERLYTRSLEINPYSATAHAHRGEIRIISGRLADGTDDLVRAVRLDDRGAEPATHRAQATLRVLEEKLGTLDLAELEVRAAEERRELEETERVVEEAVAAAREQTAAEPSSSVNEPVASGPEADSPVGPGEGASTPPESTLRRSRPKAKRPAGVPQRNGETEDS